MHNYSLPTYRVTSSTSCYPRLSALVQFAQGGGLSMGLIIIFWTFCIILTLTAQNYLCPPPEWLIFIKFKSRILIQYLQRLFENTLSGEGPSGWWNNYKNVISIKIQKKLCRKLIIMLLPWFHSRKIFATTSVAILPRLWPVPHCQPVQPAVEKS